MVPIVNLDSHDFISKSFGTSKFKINKNKRKNMNDNFC